MPSISQLEYIVAVAKVKHFGKAARNCHVSQPSLSAQIQKAEEELEIEIFDRSKKPVKITDRGQLIIDQAKTVLREHSLLFQMSQEQKEVSGSYKLAVIPTLAPYIVPLFIETFSRAYPKVQLSITECQTDEIIERLENDDIDGGLLVTPLHKSRIFEHVIFHEPFYVFSSPNHKLKNKNVVSAKELEAKTVWLLQEGHCLRNQVVRLCSQKQENQVLKNVKFESGNLETLINIIRKGEGYTLLPHLATTNLTKTERNTLLKPFSKPIPSRQVSLVCSRSSFKNEIRTALQKEIFSSLPNELKKFRIENTNIIDI